MNPSAPPFTPAQAREFMQHRLRKDGSGALSCTRHARERARTRNFDARDAVHALLYGSVDEADPDERYGSWKYRVRGTDVDGEDPTVIVALDPAWERITIITGF